MAMSAMLPSNSGELPKTNSYLGSPSYRGLNRITNKNNPKREESLKQNNKKKRENKQEHKIKARIFLSWSLFLMIGVSLFLLVWCFFSVCSDFVFSLFLFFLCKTLHSLCFWTHKTNWSCLGCSSQEFSSENWWCIYQSTY